MGLYKLESGDLHKALRGKTNPKHDDHRLAHSLLGLRVGGEEHQAQTATSQQ